MGRGTGPAFGHARARPRSNAVPPLRLAAIASMASGLTTAALIFLPDLYAPVADGLAGRMQRVIDPAYAWRAWIALLHPLLAFTAAAGLAALYRERWPVLASLGLVAFGVWAFVEVAQQALTLFAFDPWRRAWLAGDETVRATIALRTAIYDGLWDAAYNLVLMAFLAGCLAFAVLTLRDRARLARVVGVFYALAAMLTAALLVSQLGGPDLLGSATKWVYAATQPLARVLLGVWLWRSAAPILRV